MNSREWHRYGELLWWEAELGGARLLFSTRLGGSSTPPHDSLNLGLHVGDDPATVGRNRRQLWSTVAAAAAPPAMADQIHGCAVKEICAADVGRGWSARETALVDTDALVTGDVDVPLGILVADCAPVAIIAPGTALGVAHAGWRGVAGGVIEATLERLAAMGAAPSECLAVVGPCIRGCCYEVSEEVWRRFPAACLAPAGRPEARRLDLMAAVEDRLRQAGVAAGQIHSMGLCTSCHPTLFFSHRRATREGLATTGRMALFGWLR